MRFVKLSPSEFATFDEVLYFFRVEMPSRVPPGRFGFPKGHIAKDKLFTGEQVVFTYRARVRFIAQTSTAVEDDTHPDRNPHYFCVDLATLCELDEDLHAIESWYNEEFDETVALVGQGWNYLPDSEQTEALWERLKGLTHPTTSAKSTSIAAPRSRKPE